MIEVLWHGRGGQGAFTAARLLGAAASLASGKYALAFPSFGPERRGAPMRAFTKMDSRKVGDHSEIAKADFVVYLDETLFQPGWESELKDGGVVLVNSVRDFGDDRVLSLDANGISLRLLGREIPNTTFLAALSVMAETLTPEDARAAVRQYMAPKLHKGNIAIIDEVVALLEAQRAEATDACAVEADAASQDGDQAVKPVVDGAPGSVADGFVPAGSDEKAVAVDADAGAHADPIAPTPRPRVIPTLRKADLDPFEFARNTCWEAGHLVSKNAGWRVYRPVLDVEACTGCLLCYMQCPDGTIFKVEDAAQNGGAPVAIDYDFCKGCGVCVKSCKFGALAMVPEGEDE